MEYPCDPLTTEELHQALDGGRVGLWALDIETRRLIWSPNVDQLFGVPPGTLANDIPSFRQHVPTEDLGVIDRAFREALQGTPGIYSAEHRFRRPDGTLRWFEAKGQLFVDDATGKPRLTGTMTDITERKRMDEARRASELKLTTAFRSTLDAIILSRLDTGEILEVNRGFCQIFGHSREEALGSTGLELGLWTDASTRQRLVDALRHYGRVRNVEGRFHHHDGELRFGLCSAERMEIHGEEWMLMAIRDVSHLKELEQQRATLIEELEAKNADLESLIYAVSHDLKSPLVTLYGYLDLAGRALDHQGIDEARVDLDKSRRAARAMEDLIERLLRESQLTSHPQAEAPEQAQRVVDLGEVTELAREIVAGRLEKAGIRLRIVTPMPKVLGNRGRLLSVLQNLLDNAAKYSACVESPKIEVGALQEECCTEVFVRDNGLGLAPEDHEKIFIPFQRLPGHAAAGNGLGLALVKRVIEGYGGRIWVESEGPGCGSTFRFTLPSAPKGMTAPQASV